MKDFLDCKTKLTGSKVGQVSYYRLSVLEENGYGSLARVPYSLRVLLESVLRKASEPVVEEGHVKSIANWRPKADLRSEVPFFPARVLLQDFTGVPAVVDLASMRDAMAMLGGSPEKINPFVSCDLVIDHSVQVDYSGAKDSLAKNEAREFERNAERYGFLKWGQKAFENFRVVPPSTGIIHQVNLEYLSKGVFWDKSAGLVYPDSCVGTDSHTPMVNGLGVLAWGVGGIEAEAVMLNQPISMLVPDVIGVRLDGELPEGVTATDMVLCITERCRRTGVVGKFLEFFGPGLASLSVADRATISNMSPEHGCTVSFFPVDEAVLSYLRLSGRSPEIVDLVERYTKEQGLFRTEQSPTPEFTSIIKFDLSSVVPSLAGPKRPHDRVALSELAPTYRDVLSSSVGPRGLGIAKEELDKKATVVWKDGRTDEIGHGAVVIAAITSCTNTSNPAVMLAAGLLAKKAVERGLRSASYVKTSLAPGSGVVTEYLSASGLLPYLEKLGFYVVGYGCTTCIGNSGPLPEPVENAVKENDLVVSAVLSGNRNFEGRVHPLTRTNYLASPPLVVAYAIAGSTAVDITKEPIACDSDGKDVFLADIWPSSKEIEELMQQAVKREFFVGRYGDVLNGSPRWQEVKTGESARFEWDDKSTYIQHPPFFSDMKNFSRKIKTIKNARVLGVFSDSVTTDHISPAGVIAENSPAARYLSSRGIDSSEFNTYGSRRGNHEVMMRGTFANIRLKNLIVPGKEGNCTRHFPTGEEMSFFDAAERYREDGLPLVILAGREYGSGSSRDWAAKGPQLLGIRAVMAQSYERIHRSNLVGMGILPLEFLEGDSRESLGLNGTEVFSIELDDSLKPRQLVQVCAVSDGGEEKFFNTLCRIDTPAEVNYFRDGGILRTVIWKLLD